MNKTFYTVNVFIASPSDVSDYRKKCVEVMERLNNHMETTGIFFRALFYERLTPTFSHDVQNYINEAFPIENVDIFICILKSTMGTVSKDGRTGTEQEFENAVRQFEKTKSPHIMLYNAAPGKKRFETEEVRINQERVRRFLECHQNDVLACSVKNIKAFEDQLRIHLTDYRIKIAAKINRTKNTGNPALVWNSIIKKLYLQADNPNEVPSGNIFFKSDDSVLEVTRIREDRTNDKNDIMSNSSSVRLMAHAGFSYLTQYVQRMYPSIVRVLENNGRVQIILTNPFSVSGLLISIADEAEESAKKLLKSELQKIGKDDKEEVIRFIEGSTWYQEKLIPSLRGYQELRSKYGKLVQLKMLGFDMYATTLITEKGAFLEPYLLVTHEEHGMSVFETQVLANSHLYKNICENFDILWELAEDYEIYSKKIDFYKERIKEDAVSLLSY